MIETKSLKSQISFVKLSHVNYMRIGGVSDITLVDAYKEYVSLLYKYGFINKSKSLSLIISFLFKKPLILFRNSRIFNNLINKFSSKMELAMINTYNETLLNHIKSTQSI